MRIISMISAGFIILFFFSCTKEDPATAPVFLAYQGSNYGVSFYTEGSTEAPGVDWGGESGTFLLGSSYVGVIIDENTGAVSWTKDLPLGENVIQVIAKNAVGQKATEIILNHVFEGIYLGGYNIDPASTTLSNPSFGMEFVNDGTLNVNYNGALANGEWLLSADGVLTGSYIYAGATTKYLIQAGIFYSPTQNPYVVGYWKVDGSTAWNGYFKVNMQ